MAAFDALTDEQTAHLRERIAAHGLGAAEELIVQSARRCVRLFTTGPDEGSVIGVSRYGGVPDLPPGLDWPADEEGLLYTFLVQIALAEVPTGMCGPLPASGMLYLFLGFDANSGNVPVRVLYADADRATLVRPPTPPDEAFAVEEDTGLTPFRFRLRESIDLSWSSPASDGIIGLLEEHTEGDASDAYAELTEGWTETNPDETPAGKLFGLPNWLVGGPDGATAAEPTGDGPGRRLLFTLSSHREVGTCFWDAGYLQVFVGSAALERCEFGDARAEIETL